MRLSQRKVRHKTLCSWGEGLRRQGRAVTHRTGLTGL